MARTDRFRLQHDEMLALAGELQALLHAGALSKDGSPARRCMTKLFAKLTVHLAAEDRVLYPELEAHKDPAIAALARRFSTEMKSTATQVTSYGQRWSTAAAIQANAQGFIGETKKLLGIISDRMQRENRELYAAADRTEGKAFG